MIFNIYVNYNRKAEAFSRPIIIKEQPDEYVEMIKRDFKISTKEAQIQLAEFNVTHIGYFDDNTGKIDLIEPNMICNIGQFLVKEDDVLVKELSPNNLFTEVKA